MIDRLHPINRKLLIRPHLDSERQTDSGLILPAAASTVDRYGHVLHDYRDHVLYANQGEVVARDPKIDEDVEVGDWILFSPQAGDVVVLDREPYVEIHVSDVLAVIEEEPV